MTDSRRIRDHLITALKTDLVGPFEENEVLPERPSRWYLTGFLVPRGAPDEQREDRTALEELSNAPGSDMDDDMGSDERAPSINPYFPSSIGLSLLVPGNTETLSVVARWGEYRTLSQEEVDALQSGAKGAGQGTEAEGAEGGGAGDQKRGGFTRQSSQYRARKWRHTARESQAIDVPLRDGQHKLLGGEDLKVVVRTRPARVGDHEDPVQVVSVFLVNDKEPLKTEGDARFLFQAQLEVTCADGILQRTDPPYEGDDDIDEARTDLQYRHHGEWAVGHGVAATHVPSAGQRVTTVKTTWFPQAHVYRMRGRPVDGVLLDMESLTDLPDASALSDGIAPLFSAYEDWIEEIRRTRLYGLSESRRGWAEALLARALHAVSRMKSGMQTLTHNRDAFTAFTLANRVMAMAAEKARPEEYDADNRPQWRLFQLAFLLLNVDAMVDPEHPDREVVDLLFFPTGGGKTEAYFGVAAFAMILRRLKHRDTVHGGAGVTVLLRYTLRLLTLDQLGRAATLTCALEKVRRETLDDTGELLLGNRRFTVGLWVGRKATANTMEQVDKQVRAHKKRPDDPRAPSPIPLLQCPWCGEPFNPEQFSVERVGKTPVALRVGCDNLFGCDFTFDKTDAMGLPVLVADEQIYRELPSFLIGTVDKFALLPWRGETGALFGRVKACDAEGFYSNAAPKPGNAQRLPHGLPPPELIIQDELHLITGPLGTMVGLYETVIDELSRDRDGRGAKILASTATARRATEQIQALYARDQVELFPPQGVDADDTFFARLEKDAEKSRLYLGVAAPGRSSKALMVRVYSSLLSAAYKHWYSAQQRGMDRIDNPADTFMSLVAYFNTLRELGGAQRLIQEEVAPRADRLEMRHPLGQSKSEHFKGRRLSFDVLELTSRQSTEEIRDAKGRLEKPYSGADNKNDILLASSMISVGVDISRLGLMVMNGQPRTVAEYIQATSRVGRQTPGLVVTLHNLFRPRDRSHFEHFESFHRGFYRNVEASSVTPFSSRAIDRGLAAVTLALARHGHARLTPPRGAEDVDREPGLVQKVADIVAQRVLRHANEVDEERARHLRQRVTRLINDWSAVVAALTATAVHVTYSPWEGSGGKTLLRTALEPDDEADSRLDSFRAPTSMRNVESTVHLWVNNKLGGQS